MKNEVIIFFLTMLMLIISTSIGWHLINNTVVNILNEKSSLIKTIYKIIIIISILIIILLLLLPFNNLLNFSIYQSIVTIIFSMLLLFKYTYIDESYIAEIACRLSWSYESDQFYCNVVMLKSEILHKTQFLGGWTKQETKSFDDTTITYKYKDNIYTLLEVTINNEIIFDGQKWQSWKYRIDIFNKLVNIYRTQKMWERGSITY